MHLSTISQLFCSFLGIIWKLSKNEICQFSYFLMKQSWFQHKRKLLNYSVFDHSKYQKIIFVKNIFLDTLKMAKGFCVINLTFFRK